VKYELLGTNNKLLGGPDKQGGYKLGVHWERAQSNPRTRPGWTYSQGATRDSRSSMYQMYIEFVMCFI
jgi:hypothetical protein